MNSELEEEYKQTALREMSLALEWKRKKEIADERFLMHIQNAEAATALWSAAILERSSVVLRLVK